MTHDQLASDLAGWLRLRYERVTWENISFDWTDDPVDGARFGKYGRCRPDVFSIERTLRVEKCRPWVCETKVSRADFLSDIRSGKWKEYRRICSHLFFAAPHGIVGLAELPIGVGLFEKVEGAGWTMRKRATHLPGWELPSRHLMKLILGRWGTEPATTSSRPATIL